MGRRSAFTLLLAALLFAPLLAEARGGGGFGYLTDIGPGIPLPGMPLLALPTGAVHGISGFGYGITRGGWKVGGFGTCFFTLPLSVPIEALDGTLTRAFGGLGGVISGGHGRLGPFTLGLNTRLGIGGLGVEYSWGPEGYEPYPTMAGTLAAYGSVDLELGIVFVPAMMVSVYAGMDVLVTFPYAIIPLAVPTVGIRLTWGSF